MDEEIVSTLRSNILRRHYESVVEQNHPLQMIHSPFFENFEWIVILVKSVANGNKIVKSHPMAIYLRKLVCSNQAAKINKDLIYQGIAAFPTSNGIDKLKMCTNDAKRYMLIQKQNDILRELDYIKIEPRKRWNKLYDRNSSFRTVRELLSAEIANKITQLRIVQPVVGPVKYRNVDCLLRKYKIISRILVYRRCQLESPHENGCFPLIWNEPDSSNVIDQVSGENLCHITLLCRDNICECNICTTGCTGWQSSCEACKLNRFTESMTETTVQVSGSFAERCMLPIFYVQTGDKYSVKNGVTLI